MKTRTGKIARLPCAIRSQLNQRLHDGEPGHRLLEWLNALPEVREVLAAEFDGRPVNAQNLSDWRLGGYRDWATQQEALELAERLGEDAAELNADGRPPLTDTLALWLAARYAVATRRVSEAEGAEGWRLLRELCADVVELRRGDHSAERLRLEREELEFTRNRDREKTEEELWQWAMQSENRERICQGFRTSAEKIGLIRRRLFGNLPEDAAPRPGAVEGAATTAQEGDQSESSPIKPDEAGPVPSSIEEMR